MVYLYKPRRPDYEHGHYGSPTYLSWANMIQRCTNPKQKAYKYYGGRGIKVCKRWRDFRHFLADMGVRPEGMSLDRWPNKNGNYKPGNCRWATQTEQIANRRAA
jgi:hypothetical protein